MQRVPSRPWSTTSQWSNRRPTLARLARDPIQEVLRHRRPSGAPDLLSPPVGREPHIGLRCTSRGATKLAELGAHRRGRVELAGDVLGPGCNYLYPESIQTNDCPTLLVTTAECTLFRPRFVRTAECGCLFPVPPFL